MKMLNEMHGRMVAFMSRLNREIPAGRTGGKAWCAAKRACARLHNDEQGQAMIETAMTIIILTFMMACIASFGIAIYQRTLLAQAVQAGVSDMQQYQGVSGGTNPCTQATTDMQVAASQLNFSLMGIAFYENGVQVSGAACVSNLAPNSTVGVTATYPISLGYFFGSTTLTLSSTYSVGPVQN
jgi:Flp pilus assembly protein TadG